MGKTDSSMHLLLTDETNLPADPAARFVAYGGLFLPVDSLPPWTRRSRRRAPPTATGPATSWS